MKIEQVLVRIKILDIKVFKVNSLNILDYQGKQRYRFFVVFNSEAVDIDLQVL